MFAILVIFLEIFKTDLLVLFIHLNFSKNNNTVTAEYNKSCLHQFEKRAASSAYRDIHELMIVQGTVISMWMSFSF